MAIDLGDIPSGTSPSPAEQLQIRKAIGVGTTDAPTFLSVNVGSSTTSLSQLSIVGQAASNTLYLSAPNYIALNSDQISLMNASVRSGLWGRTTGITVLSGHYFGFSSSATDAGFPAATILARDADGILAQRNGTAKQALRVYNTNLVGAPEWAEFDWITSGIGNTLRIGTNLSGTGMARPIEFVVGGVVRWTIATSGNSTFTGGLTIGSAAAFSHSGRVLFSAPSVGVYLLQNNTQDGFNRIQLGGTTSAFPAIKRSGTGIHIVLADDSAFAPLSAGAISSGAVGLIGSITALNSVGASAIQISGNVSYGCHMAAGVAVSWGSGASLNGSLDTALVRPAGGTVKITDGSTGTGTIIAKLPTSSAGLASGTVWNNAGVVSIIP